MGFSKDLYHIKIMPEENKLEADVISDAKKKVKEATPDLVPTPTASVSAKASAQELKERLQWGEPGLTILDARDRESFLEERITGAMLMDDAGQLEAERQIYVYAGNDKEAQTAADKLRSQGLNKVSQLQGGLAGWKAVTGPTEGRSA